MRRSSLSALSILSAAGLALLAGCGTAETSSAGGSEDQVTQALNTIGVEAELTGDDNSRVSAALRLADGREAGTVTFWGGDGDGTSVLVNVSLPQGVAPGGTWHGLHVHANNDPANGEGCVADAAQPATTHFVSADGHFTQPGNGHGDHAGDLPPVLLRSGGAGSSMFTTDRFTVNDVRGKAVVLHMTKDNLGHVPVSDQDIHYQPNSPAATDLTTRTGNAGDRLACGLVE